ncbi:MAG: antibiotic biosynthesis monooxygenase [Deltaproteobacteria bacterium]|nr:antibiotic biosynthesis monooxygenase [Deltaproteobacteria bacterium]
MVYVVAFTKIRPGKRAEFIDMFKKELMPETLKEKGCKQYLLTVDIDTDDPVQEKDENIVTTIEIWEGMEALKEHLSSPHIKAFQKKADGITEGLSARLLREA